MNPKSIQSKTLEGAHLVLKLEGTMIEDKLQGMEQRERLTGRTKSIIKWSIPSYSVHI
jgi:hypothetical protein